MKKILVTTDLSEPSKAAFSVASKMARAFQAKIILVAIIEDAAQAALIYALDFPIHTDTEIQKQLKDKISEELSQIKTQAFGGLEVEALVHEARTAVPNEIIQLAENYKVDCIVMATHGRTGISRLLIGNITEKVVRLATCPVLTVPIAENASARANA